MVTLMCIDLICRPLPLLRQYIEKTKLKGIRYKILEFNPMVLRGKVKPDSSRPELLHPVSCSRTNSSERKLQHEIAEKTLICFAAQLRALLLTPAWHQAQEGGLLRRRCHRAGYVQYVWSWPLSYKYANIGHCSVATRSSNPLKSPFSLWVHWWCQE